MKYSYEDNCHWLGEKPTKQEINIIKKFIDGITKHSLEVRKDFKGKFMGTYIKVVPCIYDEGWSILFTSTIETKNNARSETMSYIEQCVELAEKYKQSNIRQEPIRSAIKEIIPQKKLDELLDEWGIDITDLECMIANLMQDS